MGSLRAGGRCNNYKEKREELHKPNFVEAEFGIRLGIFAGDAQLDEADHQVDCEIQSLRRMYVSTPYANACMKHVRSTEQRSVVVDRCF